MTENMSLLAELHPVSIQSLKSIISGAYQEQRGSRARTKASFTTKNLGETLFTKQVNSSKLNTSLIVSSLSSLSQPPSPSCLMHIRLLYLIDYIQLHS